jgi:hypothetical protein
MLASKWARWYVRLKSRSVILWFGAHSLWWRSGVAFSRGVMGIFFTIFAVAARHRAFETASWGLFVYSSQSSPLLSRRCCTSSLTWSAGRGRAGPGWTKGSGARYSCSKRRANSSSGILSALLRSWVVCLSVCPSLTSCCLEV